MIRKITSLSRNSKRAVLLLADLLLVVGSLWLKKQDKLVKKIEENNKDINYKT